MLNPFFSYFGSKYRVGRHYSEPKYSTIIEPFAGSAGYSLRFPDKRVQLIDSYEPIVQLWNYLIKVSEEEILSLPVRDFDRDHPVDALRIAPEAKLLLGFWLTESQTSASRYPLSQSRGGNWTKRKRALVADQLQYIRHWKAQHASYADIVDPGPATWFIDPPYQQAGRRYRQRNIDYGHLADWCKSRQGQVIVCEQHPAAWLPFVPLIEHNNASNRSYKEVVYERVRVLA